MRVRVFDASQQSSATQLRIGGCIIAERSSQKRKQFSRPELRMRDLEKLIQLRFSGPIPEHDDVLDPYLFCAANAIVAAAPVHPAATLANWIERHEPWRTPHAQWAETVISKLKTSRLMNDKKAGENLRLKLAERHFLRLKTISPHDVTHEEFSSYLADQKKAADRERIARKRARSGSRSRSEYVASMKAKAEEKANLIRDLGISRAKYYRRLKLEKMGNETRSVASVEAPLEIEMATGESEVASAVRRGPSHSSIYTWHGRDGPSLNPKLAPLFDFAAELLRRPSRHSEEHDQ